MFWEIQVSEESAEERTEAVAGQVWQSLPK